MKEKLIKCNHISVDCVTNDPVDVKAGGPYYLGFDFFVAEEKAEKMKKFITSTLAKYEVPLIGINVLDIVYKKSEDVWSEERIEESIKEDADYLIAEAECNY